MPDPTVREEIMTATYEALCEHGYTDLTAQQIADRTDKSKSLLFYHYDSIDDLVVDFFEHLFERFDARVEENQGLPPVERLGKLLDWFLYSPDDDERTAFHTAMLELRAQAPYNERYREQLRTSDDRLRATFEAILREGIETGDFREHDPAEMATLLIAAIDGARVRQLTLDRDLYLENVRTAVATDVVAGLLADGVELPAALRPVGDESRRGDRTDRSDDADQTDDADRPDDADRSGHSPDADRPDRTDADGRR